MGVTVLPEGAAESQRIKGGRQHFTNDPVKEWVRPADWLSMPVIQPTDNKLVGLYAVTDDEANFLALNATVAGATSLTFANTTSGSDSTDAATYTTASVTLTAGRTYLLSVENSHGSDATAVSAITGSAANVPTFTSRGTTQFNSNLNRVTVLSCVPTTNWTGTLTINFGGTTQTGACWVLDNVTGIGNLASDGVVQVVTGTGSSTSPSVTLAALATGSGTYGVQAHAAATASTAGAGYTEIADVTAATPGQALQTERLIAGSTTVNATITSAAWGMIGVELCLGTYTVDWGDATSDTYNSGTQANHQYAYSSISAATASTRGYRQVSVVVTPNGMWTTCNLNVKHSQSGLQQYEGKWLDISLAGPGLSSITFGNSTVRMNWIEQLLVLSSSLTSYANLFENLRSLQWVSITSSRAVTSCSSMFSGAAALRTVPLFDTSAVTQFGSMFLSTHSLQTVPPFDTGAGTDFSSMFSGAYALQEVPLFNTANATTMASMFLNCFSLSTVPAFNTVKVTNMSSMFQNCSALQTIPAFNTVALTNATSMFNTSWAASSLPTLNAAALTTTTTMFSTCPSLAKIVLTGLTRGVSFGSCSLSRGAIENIFDNLGKASGAQTVTISGNWGADSVSKTSSGTTSGSTTVTIADTSSLVVGMEISGTGISDAVAVTFQDTGDTVTRTAHGIPNDTPVGFATVVTTTGIATYTPYYVVNATADTFQVSDTLGGAAKTLTTDGSGTVLYSTTIASITANTSVELSIPASATGSVTTSSALLKRSKARIRGFTVSG